MNWSIQCKRSGGNPYVVASTEIVKDCAINGSIELSRFRECSQYLDELKLAS
jgi:hypothetical protein